MGKGVECSPNGLSRFALAGLPFDTRLSLANVLAENIGPAESSRDGWGKILAAPLAGHFYIGATVCAWLAPVEFQSA